MVKTKPSVYPCVAQDWRKTTRKAEFQLVCNENTIVTGILSKDGTKALLRLATKIAKQCKLLGSYNADHSLIKAGKAEYSLHSWRLFGVSENWCRIVRRQQSKVEA